MKNSQRCLHSIILGIIFYSTRLFYDRSEHLLSFSSNYYNVYYTHWIEEFKDIQNSRWEKLFWASTSSAIRHDIFWNSENHRQNVYIKNWCGLANQCLTRFGNDHFAPGYNARRIFPLARCQNSLMTSASPLSLVYITPQANPALIGVFTIKPKYIPSYTNSCFAYLLFTCDTRGFT